jgi:hypothetical protein
MSVLGKWATYRVVDLKLDRQLGVADTQSALLSISPTYLRRPWHTYGFSDSDEVRLTLRGIAMCEGGGDDLTYVTTFLRWAADVELSSSIDDVGLSVSSDAFARHLGWQLGEESTDQLAEASAAANAIAPAPSTPDDEVDPQFAHARAVMQRVRVIADAMHDFWTGAGHQPERPWQWTYTLNRQRIRKYRALTDMQELLDIQEPVEVAETPAVSTSVDVEPSLNGDPGHDPSTPPTYDAADEPTDPSVKILLSLLREEIVASSGRQVSARLFDEAIFNAYRYVESALQQSRQVPDIGDRLVDHAFLSGPNPIRVSARLADGDRLIQIFAGSIGLFKGDRSHKHKPSLPCRSLRECIRQLAHASSLLDLLDRDVAAAPHFRAVNQSATTLTLLAERISPQTRVLLDENERPVVAQSVGTLTVDISDVPAGDHELVLVDGSRQSPVRTIWLSREPGREAWYRVEEINIPLFTDASCTERHAAAGVRLAILESGAAREQVFPSEKSYRVGDYVSWHWDSSKQYGEVWRRLGPGDPPVQLYIATILFAGEPEAPSHPQRLIRIALQPDPLRLRVGDRAPLVVTAHITDGTATWSNNIESAKVNSAEPRIAYAADGAVIAKMAGKTVLQVEHEGHFAEMVVDVAAHPRGSVADWIVGLPPVPGIAWTPQGLILSTRQSVLRRVGLDGKLSVVAGVPVQHPVLGGSDTIATSISGNLAARLVGHGPALVFHAATKYSSSQWVTAPSAASIMGMAWDDEVLILGLSDGSIYRAPLDGPATLLAQLDGGVVVLADSPDAILALTGGENRRLWRLPKANPQSAEDLFGAVRRSDLSSVLYVNGRIYLTEFHGGSVVELVDGNMVNVASGLSNPIDLTAAEDGTIYIAEFGRGAIRRLLP